jgi:hypothetical protein
LSIGFGGRREPLDSIGRQPSVLLTRAENVSHNRKSLLMPASSQAPVAMNLARLAEVFERTYSLVLLMVRGNAKNSKLLHANIADGFFNLPGNPIYVCLLFV